MVVLVYVQTSVFVNSLYDEEKNLAVFPTVSQSPIVTYFQEIEGIILFNSRVTFG